MIMASLSHYDSKNYIIMLEKFNNFVRKIGVIGVIGGILGLITFGVEHEQLLGEVVAVEQGSQRDKIVIKTDAMSERFSCPKGKFQIGAKLKESQVFGKDRSFDECVNIPS
jgi:hypothetical protein